LNDQKGKVIRLAIEDEVKESYMNYAMSVIVSRALPDVRDGLKPVHRRILYAMNELNLRSDRPFVKAGRIVGDVLGKYHPHGDLSIYDALVRLAQDFSLRYPVIRGQGNFGSLDGDPPAAMRYTEARFERIAEEMLRDIEKQTVDFVPNYDDSLSEPTVLPTAFPFLLVNGGSGIAVGMATNMAPHNLREISEAIVAYIADPEITVRQLMSHVQGPDFPTGGVIFGRNGVRDACRTGRGRIIVRARVTLDKLKSGRDIIIINEIPYMVNKSNLVMRIADLVREKKLEGIHDLRDESGRDEPVRIVIELKRGMVPKIILNQLFQNTPLQSSFNVNNLALVDGRPRLLNLKDMIECFVEHRKEVVTRRTRFDLAKAEAREHILQGLKIALENIDEVVELIKKSADADKAREGLIQRFRLSEKQAQAILDMRLQRLTSLETKKILDELKEVLERIKYLKSLLADERKILKVVEEETREIAESYGDDRRTDIIDEEIEEFNIEDLIMKEEMAILISNRGFINRIPVSAYRRQNRGGMGSSGTKMRDEDFMEQFFIASTHDFLFFISSEGKAYWLKVHEIPIGTRISRGQNIRALLSIGADVDIATVVSMKEFSEDSYVMMATCRGIVKKVRTVEFTHAKRRGIAAINLDEQDRLVSARLTQGDDEVIIVTRKGFALRFHESSVRSTGRTSRGVRGIRLTKGDEIAGVLPVSEGEEMLLVSEFGYGKRTECSSFTPHGRGTRGQICYKVTERTGEIVGVRSVNKRDDLVCITSQGTVIKVKMNAIPVLGKNAQGVRVVNINEPDAVVGVARSVRED
jgi:DNA gyrase subunit A